MKAIWEVEAEFKDSADVVVRRENLWVEASEPETALRLARKVLQESRKRYEKVLDISSLKAIGSVDVR